MTTNCERCNSSHAAVDCSPWGGIDHAIDAGLTECDIFEASKDGPLTRDHVRIFFLSALRSIPALRSPPIVPATAANGYSQEIDKITVEDRLGGCEAIAHVLGLLQRESEETDSNLNVNAVDVMLQHLSEELSNLRTSLHLET